MEEQVQPLPYQKKSQYINPIQQKQQHLKDQKYQRQGMLFLEQQKKQNNLRILLAKSKQQAYQDQLKNYQQRQNQIHNSQKFSNKPLSPDNQIQKEQKNIIIQDKYVQQAKQNKMNRKEPDFQKCIDLDSISENSEQDFDISMNYKKDHLNGKEAQTKFSLRQQNWNLNQIKKPQEKLNKLQNMSAVVQLSEEQN